MQCTHRLSIERDMHAIRPHAWLPGPRRDDTPGRGLVIVAHLASLLSIGALVIGLTFGSIAMARRCVGTDGASSPAATAPDDVGVSRTGMTETVAGSSR